MGRHEPSLVLAESSGNGRLVTGTGGSLQIRRVLTNPGEEMVAVCADEDGEHYELPLPELWSLVADNTEAISGISDSYTSWSDVPERLRERITTIMEAVATVHTGDPQCDLFLGGLPNPDRIDPAFNPNCTSQEQRIAAMSDRMKSQGIPWSRASFFRYSKAIYAEGWKGLVHGNYREANVDKLKSAYPDMYVSICRFAAKEAKAPNKPADTFRQLCQHQLEREGFDIQEIQSKALKQLMDAAYYENRLDQPYKTRQSKAIPNRGKQGTYSEPEPFRTLQADATPLDLLCLDQKGNVLEHVQVVAVICVASRRILAIDFFQGTFGGKELRRLVIRMVQGWIIPGNHQDSPPHLPDEIWLPAAQTQKFGSMGVDRGAQFVAQESIDLMRRVGINVDIAPQGRGEVKAVIERFFHTLSINESKWPGYKGPNRLERPRDIDRSFMLTFEELSTLMWSWIRESYHNTPHSGLRVPGTNRFLTPNQYLAEHLSRVGEIRVDQDLRKLLALMESKENVVTKKGIQLHGNFYDTHPGTLADLAESHVGRQGKRSGNRVRIYYSGYQPHAILVQIAPGGELLVCAREGQSVPEPFEELITDSLRKSLLELPSEEQQTRIANAASDSLVREAHDKAKKPRRRATRKNSKPDTGSIAVAKPDSDWFNLFEDDE